MDKILDIADRLHVIADEVQGASDLLYFMREKELDDGSQDTANALLTLSKMMERYSEDLNHIVESK